MEEVLEKFLPTFLIRTIVSFFRDAEPPQLKLQQKQSRQLVTNIGKNPVRKTIVANTVALCDDLGIDVIADELAQFCELGIRCIRVTIWCGPNLNGYKYGRMLS